VLPLSSYIKPKKKKKREAPREGRNEESMGAGRMFWLPAAWPGRRRSDGVP